MKALFEYTDYRMYLKDVVEDRRERGLPASNRWFAQMLGINSNAWLTYILQGKRTCSAAAVHKLSALLRLNANEKRYFSALVKFNQAKSLNERNESYGEMENCRKCGTARVVGSDQYEFYSVWYHSAIRSIIDMCPAFGTFEKLGAMLSPPITPAEAKRSVLLLERLDLIRRDEEGAYRITDHTITTGSHEKALAITNFQRETMKLALEAFDRFPKQERDISTMTIGISQGALLKIKKLLQETRNSIAEIAATDTGSDRVIQINMQAFPFSKPLSIDESDS